MAAPRKKAALQRPALSATNGGQILDIEIFQVRCGTSERRSGRSGVGHHVRSRVEAQMNRLKLFGKRIMSRAPNRQAVETQTRIAIMNRFSALGRAEIEAIA